MRKRRDELHTFNNIHVNSRWLEEKCAPTVTIHDFEPSGLLAPALDDIEDIKACDAFVLFTVDGETPTKRGGRHWESGFAYGIGKPIIVCGPRENIFHFLPDITVCENFELVKQELLKRRYDRIRNTPSIFDPLGGHTANFAGSQARLR